MINIKDMEQEQKCEFLERAVINSSIEELSRIYKEMGFVEMSAPALGYACRYRGLEMVKAMVEMGITFDFPSTEEIERKYHCYVGKSYKNYRTNYSLYLLKIFRGDLKGACCLKGLKLYKNAKREVGKPLGFISDDERIAVLKYLFENREKVFFDPEEMLYYAIYAKDEVIITELKKLGVKFSETRVHTITEGGTATDGYWHEYCSMTGKLADEDYIEIMEKLAVEIDGKPFHYTEKIYELNKNRFSNTEIFEFFLANFKREKINKYKIIRQMIDENAVEGLVVVEKQGWLKLQKKRDEMIEYASQNQKTEALAFLLDFKNRTADFEAEARKAEKKMMAELNASPNSVMMLKKIWTYKKLEDGTLMITNYKGTDTKVTVPEKIGKSIVTAIGPGAFSGNSGKFAGMVTSNGTYEQQRIRRTITHITLPETLKYIGASAFADMPALEEIRIPDQVEQIDELAFYECINLKDITIPGSVKSIGRFVFARCTSLKRVHICDGVVEMGIGAFLDCRSLERIEMPLSVQKLIIGTDVFSKDYELFSSCKNACIYCPKGSWTEEYCKVKGFRFKNIPD